MTDTEDEPGTGKGSDLFGRGMLYVLIWSLQLVVSTVVSPVLAHTLPPAEFGSLAAAIALYQLLMVLAVFGLDQALEMQRVEDGDAPDAARGLLASGIVFGLLVVLVVGLLSPWWSPALGFTAGDPLVLITLLWTAPGAAVLMILSMLQAEDRLRRFAVVSAFSTAGGLVFGVGLMLLVDFSAPVYAWGGVLGQGIAFLLGLIWTRPRWRGVLQPAVLRRAFALGIPLVLTGLSQFILSAADRFLVQRWLGEVEVARYQVAFTVGNVMALLLAFSSKAWLPRLKAIVDPAARWREVARARDGLYWLLSWAMLGITVSAPVLLRIVAPPTYHLESLVVVVYAVGLGAFALASTAASTQMLVTERHSRPLAIAGLIAVVVKIVLSVIALPLFGLVGVASATTLAVLAEAIFLRLVVRLRHRGGHIVWPTVVVVVLTMLAGLVSTMLPQSGVWFWGRFAFSTLCLLPFVLGWLGLKNDRHPWQLRSR